MRLNAYGKYQMRDGTGNGRVFGRFDDPSTRCTRMHVQTVIPTSSSSEFHCETKSQSQFKVFRLQNTFRSRAFTCGPEPWPNNVCSHEYCEHPERLHVVFHLVFGREVRGLGGGGRAPGEVL